MDSAAQVQTDDLRKMLLQIGQNAKQAALVLGQSDSNAKNKALKAAATALRKRASEILKANAVDCAAGKQKGLSDAMIDRLILNETRIEAIAKALEEISALPDPVGEILSEWQQPNGLEFQKLAVPIGVIGIIYESRPNVSADAGALAMKAGNAVILRGGSESLHSSTAIHACLVEGLQAAGLPAEAIQLIPVTDRGAVGIMLADMTDTIDVIIPRGGKSLVERVQREARVPVLAHLEGLCHTYIHAAADLQKAVEVILNAKMRRTGVCGATETILIDEAVAGTHLQPVLQALADKGCEIRGCEKTLSLFPAAKPASEEDWRTEYLAPIVSVRVVKDLKQATDHIESYGSHHTDAIITEDKEAADLFLKQVNSAIVLVNASTQFADGGEFGFGAEIGIATGKLHARGPVGLRQLTTFKYCVRGNGQTRL